MPKEEHVNQETDLGAALCGTDAGRAAVLVTEKKKKRRRKRWRVLRASLSTSVRLSPPRIPPPITTSALFHKKYN